MNELFPGLDVDALLAAGALSPLDVELPRALSRITGEVDPLVLQGAAAAASSQQVSGGRGPSSRTPGCRCRQ